MDAIKLLFLILASFYALPGQAQAPSASPAPKEVQEMKLVTEKKQEVIKIKTHKEMKFSQNCFVKGKTDCLALQALDKKVQLSESKLPLLGNPASRFCMDHKGTNRILLDKHNSQYDYCMFPDGSMVDAWDLYYHFYPQKVAK